jgi:hypothetical protein
MEGYEERLLVCGVCLVPRGRLDSDPTLMRKEWMRVIWPKEQRTFDVCQGKLLVSEIPITGMWLCSEVPDQEVRRERVALVSATKVICSKCQGFQP